MTYHAKFDFELASRPLPRQTKSRMESAPQTAPSAAEVERALTLYVTEIEPSPVEKRALGRWILLALLALALHLGALYLSPGWFRPAPPPPIEVEQIDPAKLAALKQQWKERGFLLQKNPDQPKEKVAPPKDARYESDRNRAVEKETRARETNVIPRVGGKKVPQTKSIPLSNLSNFQGLPVPGPRPDEIQGETGPTADQALNDRTLSEGAENMLNTVESVYYSFYSRIYEQIGPLWQSMVSDRVMRRRPPPGDHMTQAEIIFDGDGNFRNAVIHRSSGYPDLDGAVSEAWRKIPRFPNPPRGLIQSDGYIHMLWTFTVRVDDRMQWQPLPPERQN